MNKIHECVLSQFDYDSQEYFYTMRTVYGDYVDVTTGIESVEAESGNFKLGHIPDFVNIIAGFLDSISLSVGSILDYVMTVDHAIVVHNGRFQQVLRL